MPNSWGWECLREVRSGSCQGGGGCGKGAGCQEQIRASLLPRAPAANGRRGWDQGVAQTWDPAPRGGQRSPAHALPPWPWPAPRPAARTPPARDPHGGLSGGTHRHPLRDGTDVRSGSPLVGKGSAGGRGPPARQPGARRPHGSYVLVVSAAPRLVLEPGTATRAAGLPGRSCRPRRRRRGRSRGLGARVVVGPRPPQKAAGLGGRGEGARSVDLAREALVERSHGARARSRRRARALVAAAAPHPPRAGHPGAGDGARRRGGGTGRSSASAASAPRAPASQLPGAAGRAQPPQPPPRASERGWGRGSAPLSSALRPTPGRRLAGCPERPAGAKTSPRRARRASAEAGSGTTRRPEHPGRISAPRARPRSAPPPGPGPPLREAVRWRRGGEEGARGGRRLCRAPWRKARAGGRDARSPDARGAPLGP